MKTNPPDLATQLTDIAHQLERLDRSEIKAWLARGELLARAHAMISGTFDAWLRQIGHPKRTAYRAMQDWRNFGNAPTSARFSKAAMQILAQSAEAREDAIEFANHSKERVTARIARRLVDQYKPADNGVKPAKPDPYTHQVTAGFVTVVLQNDQPTKQDICDALREAYMAVLDEVSDATRDRLKTRAA